MKGLLARSICEKDPKAWRRKAQVGSGRRSSLDFILKMMAVVGLELGGIWFTEDGGDEGFN